MLTWVTDPPLIKKIPLGEYENFPKTPVERRVLGPLLGNGMLVSGGRAFGPPIRATVR